MKYEMEAISAETRRYFATRTLKNGLRRATASVRSIVIYAAIIIAVMACLSLCVSKAPEYLQNYLATMLAALFPAIILLCTYGWGYVPQSGAYYRNFVRIGFVNAAGEAPVLINIVQDSGKRKLTFESRGLLPKDWRDNVESIQSALNLTVGNIRQGYDFRTVTVTVVPPNMTFGKTIMWDDKYIDYERPTRFCLGKTAADDIIDFDIEKTPMWLIGGSTGSGKTRLAIVLLLQAIMRDYRVFICDFKGLDFFPLVRRDARMVTDAQAIIGLLGELESMIESRGKAFAEVEATSFTEYIAKTKDPFCKRVIVLIDEMSMLTDYGRSKEAKQISETIVDKLAGIARVGRAYGIYLIVSTQRPDANAVPGPIKSNLDGKICGKADQTLSTIILGNGSADSKIPKDAQGRFVFSNGTEDAVFQAFYFDE